MIFNIKNLIKTLPKKDDISKNSYKNFDSYDNYCISICKIVSNDILNINIEEEKYLKIINYLQNKKWDKIISNDCKYYYYNDLVLIINNNGDMWCKKDKIFSYTILNSDNTNNDFKINLYRTNMMSEEFFPPITNYNNMKYVQKNRYIKDGISYELLLINNLNKCNTFEFKIYGNKKLINKMLTTLVNIMKNVLNQDIKTFDIYNLKIIKNYDISKLSLSIV